MEIVAGVLEWTQIDEENLAKFLDTPTGQRFIPKLAESAPVLFAEGEINKILIRTGEVRGFQGILKEILSLAHPEKPAPETGTTEYPSLTNDKAWNDGKKLDETKPE